MIISINVFRRRIHCHIPSVFHTLSVDPFPKIAVTQICLHHKAGNGSVKSFFTIFSKPGQSFQFVGVDFCIIFHEMVHDLLMFDWCFFILEQSIKVVAIPAVVGKYRQPFPGNKPGFFCKEFSVKNIMSFCNGNPPSPRIPHGIIGPPIFCRCLFFQGESQNLVLKKRKKTNPVDIFDCLIHTVDAFWIIPCYSMNDPLSCFVSHGFFPFCILLSLLYHMFAGQDTDMCILSGYYSPCSQ